MKFLIRSILKIGITILITLVLLINIKRSDEFKKHFYEQVYENSFNFAQINYLYQNLFGSSFPFKDLIDVKPVFKENLVYDGLEEYLDGISLSVTDYYLVPVIKSGLVIFIGEKEGYGEVVVIEQVDGVDCWYGNLDSTNVSLYDYVDNGSILGSVNNNLYLVYKKDGKVVSYEDYFQ